MEFKRKDHPCIELYPQELAEANLDGHLPLHFLLKSYSSSNEDALMMMEKLNIQHHWNTKTTRAVSLFISKAIINADHPPYRNAFNFILNRL
jgi:hypothetical protein